MRRTRLWTGLSSLCSVFLVISILGMNCMMGYEGTVNSALGIKTSKVVNEDGANAEDTTYFQSEYGDLNAENLQKLISDTYDESVEEQEEGSVLLKNENNTLPMKAQGTRITLFGHSVVQPVYKNASAGSKGYEGKYCVDLYNALKDAGFEINDTLYNAYKNSKTSRSTGVAGFGEEATAWDMGEESAEFYTDELKQSWEDDYNDAAIVMLSREAGEGVELYTQDEEGVSQLALHQDEKDMLSMIRDSGKFDKIILLVNSGNAMELDWLDEYGIDACLWIGLPGQRGFEGVVNLLTGEADPSGHLTDTYASNSLSAPAVVNGSYNNQNWTNAAEVVEKTGEDESEVSWYSVQAESIYVGYKYYETRYEDQILGQGNADSVNGSSDGEKWDYSKEVTYPFGYGLSYTEFEQKLDKVENDGDTVKVTVTVTNTGNVSGKSVVQVYAQTPYGEYEKENKVEKSAIQLLDFGKTKELKPGESETLEIECDKYLLASYDYTNLKGYYLSEGDYYIAIGEDAHDALNNVLAAKGADGMFTPDSDSVKGDKNKAYQWQEAFDSDSYAKSSYTDEEVTNQFETADINYWIDDAVTYLSRSDWDGTYPTAATELSATEEMMEELKGDYYEKPEDAPSVSDYTLGDKKNIPLAAMIGKDYDDPAWEEYLNQFTLEELAVTMADNFGTAEIPTVGKSAIVAGDGADGMGGTFNKELYGDDRDDCAFPCENILASTFNKNLMQRRGELLGEEALYLGFTEVWMPGVDLHRTPFGGRNFEYYSEDAVMNYLCEIPEVEGISSKGICVGAKHFAGNDQENNRKGISLFFNEQAFREGALRGCEGALAGGRSQSVMHGFNRIGMRWCSSCANLITQVLENEWGFAGHQETDAVAGGGTYRQHYASSIDAGTHTYCLDFSGDTSKALVKQIESTDDGYLLGKVREATHRYLYMVAHSAAMNGQSVDSEIVSVTPWWKPVMSVLMAVFTVLEVFFLVMGYRSSRKSVKGEKKKDAEK